MSVLCVAEKPSIAKEISNILSGGQRQVSNSRSPYHKNFEFDYQYTRSHFIVTSVSGHLTETDFPARYNSWQGCDPADLFDAQTEVTVKNDLKAVEDNLMTQARRVATLMIWTDCDREGEHIGMEIVNICRRVKPNIRVQRARFSAIIPQQIHRAAQNPVELDRRQADAVDARIILDLKIGAAFTRLQTLTLRNVIPVPEKSVISFGPCQFPTLGFVVERFMKVKDFRPEHFWFIHLELTRDLGNGDTEAAEFRWKRGHVFDQHHAIAIYDGVLENPRARVTNVTRKETKKWKPLPLTTVELQKAGSRLLKMSPQRVLEVAEKLYNNGFLSYPRTETDQFDPAFDFQSLINKQTADPAWGGFAQRLQDPNFFSPPRKGKNNDKAHPPIHPTAHAANLDPEQKKVYEYVVRRFLAACSQDAKGMETKVDVVCGGEEFSTTGLIVLEKNYLDVYPYDKWSSKTLPNFQEGEEFDPSICTLKDGDTSPPKHLTEADLVTLMDKNGIGTDATIAQHIQTIVKREYVLERMEGSMKYLVPTTLGIGLVQGYNELGLPKSVSKPSLRRETERRMVQVCEGATDKAEMLRVALDQYKAMFEITQREFQKVANSVRRFVVDGGNGGAGPGNGPPGGGGGGPGAGGGGGGNNRGNGGPGGRGPGGGGGAPPRPPPSRNRPDESISIDSDDDGPPPPRPAPPPRQPASKAKPPTSSRSTRTQAQSNANGRPNVVLCHCGIPAVQTVTTKGSSQGRPRWGCSKTDDSCLFFQWISDDPQVVHAQPYPPPGSSSTTTSTNTVPAKRGPPANEETRQCLCGVDSVQRTVVKEGSNKGRVFWACSSKVDRNEQGCGFFEWADEPPRPRGGGGGSGLGSRTASSGAGGGGSNNVCYKCNQEGHWANACPNGDAGNKRPRSFNTSFGGGTPSAGIRCFKCQEPGHLAPDCPGSGGGGSSFGGGASKGGANGDCFKCGGSGHWSKDCPGESRAPSRSGSYSKSSGTSKRGRGAGSRGGGRGSKRGRGAAKKSNFAAADFY